MSPVFQWAANSVPRHIATVESAQRLFDVIPQAVQRIYAATIHTPDTATLSPLASGGAMAVYRLTVPNGTQPPYEFVCKIPHIRRLVYTSGTEAQSIEDSTRELLERLVQLADHLAQRTPGLFPRSGGSWHWHDDQGTAYHLFIEEFIPGLSLERVQMAYEEQFFSGAITQHVYNQRRAAVQRLAMATFTRLWDSLGRQMFTSDPSPWNILVHQPQQEPLNAQKATIIDLHGLEEPVGLDYVVQRLAAVYGMRQEVIEEALIPGIYDALGAEEGRSLLLATLPQLEIDAEKVRRNLGVDMQQPLLRAIRALE